MNEQNGEGDGQGAEEEVANGDYEKRVLHWAKRDQSEEEVHRDGGGHGPSWTEDGRDGVRCRGGAMERIEFPCSDRGASEERREDEGKGETLWNLHGRVVCV